MTEAKIYKFGLVFYSSISARKQKSYFISLKIPCIMEKLRSLSTFLSTGVSIPFHSKKGYSVMIRPLLAAFDFDHTICDDNSDIVARKLLPNDKIPDSVKRMYQADNWNVYMGKIFELLNENYIDVEKIETAINQIPPVSGIDTLLTELHSRNCEIIIISDSNSLFIEWWLNHKSLSHTVKQIFTNPVTVEEGMLKIEMYHLQDYCKLSSKNLCKGQILEDYVAKRSSEGVSFEKIAYIGDGRNDFCPILRLSEKDVAFPRLGYTLVNILNKSDKEESQQVKAHIVPWENGEGILEDLKNRIDN